MKNAGTLETLYKLKKEILKSDNEVLVSQIDHAIMKTYKDQLVFSFIGHYSAGKSSLINHMLNRDILPSSPVPTTSNTVSVQIGESEEIHAFVDQYRYIPLESYEALRDLNTRDLDIASIAMDVKHPVFKDKTVFQDTPGVDSSTASHEESASRFLLNSDYIFFTVEYNHVESEHNLKLLREISNLGIPLSLIINQVDKHDDNELSMETFLSRIRSTLRQWKIDPENIFTTTIYDSPYNEVISMTNLISEIEREKDAYQSSYHDRIIANIEDSQTQYLSEALSRLYSDREDAEGRDLDAVTRHMTFLEQEIDNDRVAALHGSPELLAEHVKEKSRSIAKNSYLFPHQVKTAITDFLKVLSGEIQPGGFFGKRRKQQALYESHKDAVSRALGPVIKTEIDAQINGLFGSLGLTGEPFRYEWHTGMLHEEEITTLNSTYILNYLDKLKRTLEKDISNQAVDHSAILEASNVESMKADEDLAAELADYHRIENLLKLKASVETKNYRHFYIHMDDEVDKLNLTEPIEYDFEAVMEPHEELNDVYEAPSEEDMDIRMFRRIESILRTHPRHARFEKVISDKLDRIDNGMVNISVFGGFSAGKTTFINALLGDAKLKTSPNPTTAAITEIGGGDDSYALYKEEADLTETLEVITNQEGGSVEDFMPWMKRHRNSVTEAYMPFVNGIYHNYDNYKASLGTTAVMSADALIHKISTDHDAIFIHKARLAVKNELTDRFTIVDSPGINSINQRHTKETHNIIAGSDLIIYVSYYNHVFSRSDESFLKYIQSIKGADFPVIFIINAVDLMKSEADMEKVTAYMNDALKRLQIKNVIYPVSSKRALGTGDAGFDAAKKGITDLAEKNAAKIQYASLKEANAQLVHTLQSNIRRYGSQQEELSRIESIRTTLIDQLDALSTLDAAPLLEQEIDIITAHLDRQLELKLYDHLKGVITASDAGDRKYLDRNESYLISSINQFISIEAATSFNAVYRKADDELEQVVRQFNERLKEANTAGGLSNPPAEEEQLTLSIDAAVLAGYQKPLHQSRNDGRAFRDQLLQLSGDLVRSLSRAQLKASMERMIRTYLEHKNEALSKEKQELLHALKEPLPEMNEADYKEDTALLNALKDLNEVRV